MRTPRKVYITFSGARYHETTKAIVMNAPKLGADIVKVYDDSWLIEKHPEFIEQRKDIFYPEQKYLVEGDKKTPLDQTTLFTRGFGWFCWKPFVIQDALSRYCQHGDIVLFTDADTYPIEDLNPFYDICEKEGGIMLFSGCGFKQRHWCKKDCDDIMGVGEKYRDYQAGCARYMLFKKGAKNVDTFLEMWLRYASIKKATTFEKSANEYTDLQQHRTEQAIMTNLAHMFEIPLHREACEAGNVCIK